MNVVRALRTTSRRLLIATTTLLVVAVATADERLAVETFADEASLTFGPDNATTGCIRKRTFAKTPFESLLEIPAETMVHSAALDVGSARRGRLEDVVWLRLSPREETAPGRRRGFQAVGFDAGGPEVRIVRATTRAEATVTWYDGTEWQQSGTVIALNRDYRLRTVIDLDLGTMDVYLREEPAGKERTVTLGSTFRAFTAATLRRTFHLGRPTELKVGLAGWQLWRTGESELLRHGTADGAESVMRYAAPVALTGDAVRAETAIGTIRYTLAAVGGLVDDMELPDVSRWRPPARVQRQPNVRRSGRWSLGLSEGARPVDTDVTLPRGDFSLTMRFLVPRTLPANRQIYLVRFKNVSTGAEPVGPSIYLDYAAAPDGKSLVICQLRPDRYFAQEVDVKPEKWYGIRVVSERARSAYRAWFVNADDVETPIRDGETLDFFLSSPIAQEVQWRFFSIVSMRGTVSDWPKIDLKLTTRRVRFTPSAKVRKSLGGLGLRGLHKDHAKNVDLANPRSVERALSAHPTVIEKRWDRLRITETDAEKLKDYVAFYIYGNIWLPYSRPAFSLGTSGSAWLRMQYHNFARVGPTAADEFTRLVDTGGRSDAISAGPAPVQLFYVPPRSGRQRLEVRVVHPPTRKPEQHLPIPEAWVAGRTHEMTHPGAAFPLAGAATTAEGFYVALPYNALAVYTPELLRVHYDPRFFEKVTGGRWQAVSAFAADAWSKGYWVHSGNGRIARQLDGQLKPTKVRGRLHSESVAMAAGPDAIYVIDKAGGIVRTDKFFATRRAIPLDKMFGGKPLFAAAACVDRFLYLATRADSPLYPAQVICVDTKDWNPIFSVELKDRYDGVTAMTTDGETMYLFGRTNPDVASFRLPPKHELEPQKTFIYLDDIVLKGVKTAGDVRLIPDDAGGVSGWGPPGALRRREDGSYYLPSGVAAATYDKAHIAYVGKSDAGAGFIRLRTGEPSRSSMLYLDINTAASSTTRRAVIHYWGPSSLERKHPAFFGKTYRLGDLFADRTLSPLWYYYRSYAKYIEGPVGGIDVKVLRVLPIRKGFTEHVFSFEKDLGIKAGDTINGIRLTRYRRQNSIPIYGLTLSPSRWTPRESARGSVVSRPVFIDRSRRRLAYLSWEGRPFDVSRGSMTVSVRTAAEKYDIDRAPWVAVTNQQRLDTPLGGYLQWRIDMNTEDPWRAPGVANLLIGLGATDPETDVLAAPAATPRWRWLILLIPAAGLAAWAVIGRKSLWQKKKGEKQDAETQRR